MIIRYFGHSMFSLQLENGVSLITDPYGDFYDYPKQKLRADLVTESHQHHDHNGVQWITGEYALFDRPGRFPQTQGISITGIESLHDNANGTLRGTNTIFRLELEGLTVVHLGDLGHIPTDAQRKAIGTPDVLLIPVGGIYTLDAATAVQTVRMIAPKVAIPMHYKTVFSAAMPIADETPFLQLMGAHPEPMPLCRITAGDVGVRPPVITMRVITPDTYA